MAVSARLINRLRAAGADESDILTAAEEVVLVDDGRSSASGARLKLISLGGRGRKMKDGNDGLAVCMAGWAFAEFDARGGGGNKWWSGERVAVAVVRR
jgi:hypothetical protein